MRVHLSDWPAANSDPGFAPEFGKPGGTLVGIGISRHRDPTGRSLLGRDQIWFTEKDADGSTTLRPLADFSPRRSEAVGRRYLAGMYGARPILAMGDFVDALAPVVGR